MMQPPSSRFILLAASRGGFSSSARLTTSSSSASAAVLAIASSGSLSSATLDCSRHKRRGISSRHYSTHNCSNSIYGCSRTTAFREMYLRPALPAARYRRQAFVTSTTYQRKPALEQPSAETTTKESDDCDDAVAGDECPPWQNPLHHNNPEYTRVLSEEFEPGEEMPVVPLPPFEEDGDEDKVLAPPHLHQLADEIVRLNMLEVKELVDRIGDHFGFSDEDDYMDMGGGGGGGDDGEGATAAQEAKVEKTVFDLKLTGFDAKAKIKVIKEIRGITNLGLKEAKELVEGAPATIKKDIKKEEAEELKAKLEGVGATVEIV